MPDGPIDTTAAAIEAARHGDHGGWEWLFDRYYSLVRRYVGARLRSLGGADVVEDVVQETFVAAVSSISRLRSTTDTGVEGWLLGIARNKTLDMQRRQYRTVTADDRDGRAADPADVAVDRLSAGELAAALDDLSEDQRDVLIRRFVLDQGLEHVAATTGRSLGAVKALQHRGLASLRRLLEERS